MIGALVGFQVRTILRGRWALAGSLAFGGAAVVLAILGLGSFRQLGLGAAGPASVALLNLALLLPTAQAVLLGAQALSSEREHGFLAAVIGSGGGQRGIVLSVWVAVTAATWLALLIGFGAVAVIFAGNVPVEDLLPFAGMVATTFGASAAAAAIGVLVGALVSTRLHAALVGLAVWFVMAVGLDLLVIGLGVFLRAGEPALLAAVLANPFEAARVTGLLIIDAHGTVLGPLGTFMRERLGTAGAFVLLGAAIGAWTVLALAAASRVLSRRDA